MEKVRVAVFFGAKSFEHDISILTGLEACQSLDIEKYEVIPVYVDLKNHFWTGDALMNRTIYPLTDDKKYLVNKCNILMGEEKPTLQVEIDGMFRKKQKKVEFDVALLAFHGDYGENGVIQGMFEMAGIPYTGCRQFSSGLCMNKIIAKNLVKKVGVPVLDEFVIGRPKDGEFYDIEKLSDSVPFDFPVIVKPIALGSSIGVSKAENKDELSSSILQVFALGEDAVIEPFVENLEEYNVSLTKAFDGTLKTSIIEHPFKKNAKFLGFVEKYLSGGGKGGVKKAGSKLMSASQRTGMVSMTRDFNPKELSEQESKNIIDWARKSFEALGCNGVVRIDFMCNSKTREFYFTEANTIPGSFSYYLWEASQPSYTYTDLMTAIINEAIELNKEKRGDVILSASNSKIFKEQN